MKSIMKYFCAILACLFVSSTFVSCEDKDDVGPANLGLGVKVFAPTHVVPGTPMTINGSGLALASEIEFPGGIKVSAFEIIGDDMIRLTAPEGLSQEGKIIVRNSNGEFVESRVPLTIGKTVLTGASKQPGELIKGKEEITFFGEDLQFINEVELIDEEENPLIIPQTDFIRLATNRLVVKIPNNVYEGIFVGKIHTFDGHTFAMPELEYEQVAEGGGHWEVVKKVLWENISPSEINWSSDYRFSNVETSTGEECYAFPMEDWDVIKNGTFKVDIQPTSDWVQMRVTTGWWSTTWTGDDITTGDERYVVNEDGTWSLEINFAGDPILDVLDQQHLLFTGSGYKVLKIYTEEEVWVGGGGGFVNVRTSLWKNDGSLGEINWSSDHRFSNVETSTGEECYAFPMEDWDVIKNGTFKVDIQPTSDWVQMRVTTGWWSTTWTGDDITTGNERYVVNEDGTWSLEINFAGDPILDVLDQQHLLFTGSGYKLLEIYTEEEVWVDGGGAAGLAEVTLWEGELVADDWDNQPFALSDAGAELADAGAKVGDIVYFYLTPMEDEWLIEILEGHWGPRYGAWCYVGNPDLQDKFVETDLAATGGKISITLTQEMLDAAFTQQWWGGVFVLNGDNVKCTKITLLSK